MSITNFDPLMSEMATVQLTRRKGQVCEIGSSVLSVKGLQMFASVGDLVEIASKNGTICLGEVLGFSQDCATILPEYGTGGASLGDLVELVGDNGIAPDQTWLGRVVDPFGRPLDDRPLFRGKKQFDLRASPPPAASRRRLGRRLPTGLAAFNTFFPVLQGQRLGLFAGSGVGKSTLIADLAKGLEAEVVVLALIGERGRELRGFLEDVLSAEGLKRAVVIAATSDQSPMIRRRAAWTAMAVAEYFRDLGAHVLFLADSITRFAEAHREIATATGEAASLRGFPPSTSQTIMELCERAGPGPEGSGDITAVLSVLVAGSDMDEPIADIVRGVLDGHIVLDRKIAEAGRFPAIDVLRSVSRSLPEAATDEENALLSLARQRMGDFSQAELMIKAGLYKDGTDAKVDEAIETRPKLEVFLAQKGHQDIETSFARLKTCLELGG